MAESKKGGDPSEIRSSSMNVEFELNDAQRKELMRCVEKSGKVTLKFKKVGDSAISNGILGGITDIVIVD